MDNRFVVVQKPQQEIIGRRAAALWRDAAREMADYWYGNSPPAAALADTRPDGGK